MIINKTDLWSKRCPKRIAHQYRDSKVSYETLKIQSDALCLWLNEQMILNGIPRKSPVIVYGHKQPEMIASFLACSKAAHPYIPVDVSVPPERLRQIIESSGAKILLSPETVPENINDSLLLCEQNISMASPSLHFSAYLGQVPQDDWKLKEDDVCYIIYTSGSTGIPKGVQITLRSLESFVNWMNSLYQPREMAEVFLNQAPFSFDLSVMDLYMSLSSGGTLWSIDRELTANPWGLFISLGQSSVSYWVSTPSFAELCLMDRGFNRELLPDIKYFLFCGEILTNDTAAKLKDRFPGVRVENTYGPTEATVAVTNITVTTDILNTYSPLPVGVSKPDCRIVVCQPEKLNELILERAGRLQAPPEPLPDGERGEIIIAGPSVSIGYINNPKQTERAFFFWEEDGKVWPAYRTGDGGFWNNGLLFYQGRLDFQVKLHGYRIELGDIEENLRQVQWVENAVVLAVEKKGRVEYLKAFVTTTEPVVDEFEARQKLRKSLQQKLPEYMLPRSFAFVAQMPMTPNGKIDRRKLLGSNR